MMLGRGLADAARNLTRFIRLLARQNLQERNVLERSFRYGTTNMQLEYADFDAYHQLAGNLVNNLLEIQGASLGIIRHHPEMADRLGIAILEHFGSLPEIVNGFYLNDQTNGQVLDQCLELLRAFERILGRLTDGN